MRRSKIMVYAGLAACAAFMLFGCATSPTAPASPPAQGGTSAPTNSQVPSQNQATPPKSDIWPKIYDDDSYLTDFASNWSEAEAVGSIKNLQDSIVDYSAGIPLTSLDVDPYGMRARYSWTDSSSVVKSSGFIVPFDQVTSLLLENYPKLENSYKWGLQVYLAGQQKVSVRTPNRDTAERLGKAILVLAKARGAKVSLPDMHFGAALAPLTEAQAQAAGILPTDGVIVSWIFMDSPASRAAFSPQDILTSVNGTTIHKTDDIMAAIDAAFSSGAKGIKISGLRRTYILEKGKYIEQFVPLTYNLVFGSEGGTK